MPELGSTSLDRYHLGVLLVHGMGEQPEGDTLLAFGEPIVRWLRRWFDSSVTAPASQLDKPTIEEVSASLHPSRELRAEPAHAELRVRALDRDGHPVEQRWLMAESWWGGDVQRPPFGKLAFWMLTIGAWIVFSHFGKRRRFGEGIWAETKAVLVSLGVSLPIVLAFQLIVLVLSILAVLPVPQLRRSLSTMLLAMTGVLGDAFVLIESPLQRAAIVERARRSLRWLAERCEGVVVLAHSQGAAIAYDALRRDAPRNLEGLLTFGSGLQKLTQIEFAQRRGQAMPMAVATLLTAAMVALAIAAFILFRLEAAAQLGIWMLAVLALMSFVPLHLTTRTYWLKDATPQANALTKHLSQLVEAKSWVDVFATNDPVSNGPLYRDIPPSGPVSKEVVNRRSFLDDHTTYWENDAEFLPTVACSLQRGAGLRIIAPADCPAMQAAVVRYRWCVGWLAVNWWAALTGLATVAVAVFAGKLALAPWGDATQAALGSIPLGVKGLADGFVNLADVLVAWVGGCAKCGAGKIALGFLPPLAVIVLLKMAFVQAWRLWARETAWQALTDRRVASAPVSAPSPGADGTITAATDPRRVEAPSVGGKLPIGTLGNIAVISLAAMPLVLSLAWLFVKPEQVLRVFLWILGGLVVLAMSVTLGGLVVQLKDQARALRASGGRGFGVWRDIVIVVVMLAAVLTAIVSYVPGAPTWLPPLIIMVMSGLLFLLVTLAAWANLFGRFEGAAWKALTISVPLLIGAGLSKSTLLRPKASPKDALATASISDVLAVPVLGVLLGLGLIWLIATLAGRRVREAHRRGTSPPEG